MCRSLQNLLDLLKEKDIVRGFSSLAGSIFYAGSGDSFAQVVFVLQNELRLSF